MPRQMYECKNYIVVVVLSYKEIEKARNIE
jgi:hypothetical protein